MKKVSILFLVIIIGLLYSCGGGGGGGGTVKPAQTESGTTPININDDYSLHGTYQYTYYSMDCTNGVDIDSEDFDEFSCFLGYNGIYEYYNMYMEYNGNVTDETFMTAVATDTTTTYYSYIDPYNVRLSQYNIYEGSGVYCDYEIVIRKLTDDIDLTYLSSSDPNIQTKSGDNNLPYFAKPLLSWISTIK